MYPYRVIILMKNIKNIKKRPNIFFKFLISLSDLLFGYSFYSYFKFPNWRQVFTKTLTANKIYNDKE